MMIEDSLGELYSFMSQADKLDTGSPHPYIPNTDAEREAMLTEIGVESVDELFSVVPEDMQIDSLNLPPPMTEFELRRHYERLAGKNVRVDGANEVISFLGGKACLHAIPSAVPYITGKGEFLTAYTPYQPEVSQGTLTAGFLLESYMCHLTSMEICNAGMYDGSTALAEAALMTVRITNRQKVIVSGGVRTNAQEVVKTYCSGKEIEIVTVALGEELPLDTDTAAVLIQSPNVMGYIEDIAHIQEAAAAVGALTVVSANPLSLALFKPPGEHGADIVVGEAQPLGIAPNFGGPHLGFFATKEEEKYRRQLPGRIIGETTDANGKRAFVLTHKTREQDIRREKATSNICTSQQLLALTAAVYLTMAGNNLAELARLNHDKAYYAASALARIPGLQLPKSGLGEFFNEFTITSPLATEDLNRKLFTKGIVGGRDVSNIVANGMAICVTEMHSADDIDRLAQALAEISKDEGWSN